MCCSAWKSIKTHCQFKLYQTRRQCEFPGKCWSGPVALKGLAYPVPQIGQIYNHHQCTKAMSFYMVLVRFVQSSTPAHNNV